MTCVVSQHRHDIPTMTVESCIRESPQQCATHSWHGLGVHLRCGADDGKLQVERYEKLFPQTWRLRLIPLMRLADLPHSARGKGYTVRHVPWRIRLRTSSQGTPDSGLASNSARRASRSGLTSGDKGRASGTSVMLSQMSSSSRSRSATGNSRISATGSLSITIRYHRPQIACENEGPIRFGQGIGRCRGSVRSSSLHPAGTRPATENHALRASLPCTHFTSSPAGIAPDCRATSLPSR